MISIQGLIEKFRDTFRLIFDDHGLEWQCRGCGESLRFTHRSSDDAIEAELLAHKCERKAAA